MARAPKPKPLAEPAPMPEPARPGRRDEALPEVPDGFTRVGASPNMITATRDVYIQFVPRGVTRPSTVLAFPRACVTTVEEYHKRIGMYAHHQSIEVK
jgi:hypothetical protein